MIYNISFVYPIYCILYFYELTMFHQVITSNTRFALTKTKWNKV